MKQYEIAHQLKEDGYKVQYPSTDTYHEEIYVLVEGQCLNIDADADYEEVLAAIESIKAEKRNARLSSWGGKREGAGRKVTTGTKPVRTFRLNDSEYAVVKKFIEEMRKPAE